MPTAERRAALWLLATLLAAYANALCCAGFQFDDFNVIVDNPVVHSWMAWWADLGHGIRPLLKLSYTLDWIRGGGQASSFHSSNVLIHAVNTGLVWHLALAFCRAQARLVAHAAPLALACALCFAVHPAQTEAVTYVSGRSAALMSLFYLAALRAHARRPAHAGLAAQWPTALCLLAALAVKETAVTLPFALLLWDLCVRRLALGVALRRAAATWLLWLLAVAFLLSHAGYRSHMATSADFNTLAGNLATQGVAVAWLLRQWLAPFWLNIDPDLPVLTALDAGALASLLPLAALCGLTATLLAPRLRNRRPWLAFGLSWPLLQWLPLYLVLPRLDVANERQLYLATWPLALALLCELRLAAAMHRVWHGAVLAATLLGIALSHARNRDYRDEIALWQATVRVSPYKARVHNNLGWAYAQAGRPDEARAAWHEALRLDPTELRARANLRRQGDAPAAPR